MGNCYSAPTTIEGVKPAKVDNIADVRVIEGGEEEHLHVRPSAHGPLELTAASEPMTIEEQMEVAKVLADNKEVKKQYDELGAISDMRMTIRSSKSGPFIGLLVVDVKSACLTGCKSAQVQVKCEDDKGVFIKHHKLPNKQASMPRSGFEASSESGPCSLQRDSTSKNSRTLEASASAKMRSFEWRDARFVFVVVYSHAHIEVVVRDGSATVGGGSTAVTQLAVRDLEQGSHLREVRLLRGDKEVGSATLHIRYDWLRGTRDTGQRYFTDKITVQSRKLRSLRGIVNHISNVNHWLLSHDNVWAVLPPDHAAFGGSADTRTSSLPGPSPQPDTAPTPELNGGMAGVADLLDTPASPVQEPVKFDTLDEAQEPTATLDALRAGTNGALPPSMDRTSVVSSSSGGSRNMTPAELWCRATRKALAHKMAATAQNNPNPQSALFETSLMDAFGCTDEPASEVQELKLQVGGMLALLNDRITSLEGTVRRQQDVIMQLEYKLELSSTGDAIVPYISGRFGYGLGRAASKREVLLFARRAQDATPPGTDPDKFGAHRPALFLGKHITDASGVVGPVTVPKRIACTPGHYNVVALLPEDHTFAKGSIFILAPGTKCVVMDVDGTLTVGDQEVVAQFALNAVGGSTAIGDKMLARKYDLKQRHHSRTLARLWAAKGYQVVYLSGRQGSFYNLTLAWLIKHNYPPGPIHLTRTHVPTLPMYFSVGNFKVEYMETLKRRGFEIYAAYGNTSTDVRAYQAVNVPKERTFMIGQGAGSGGTVAIKNWTRHLETVLSLPDADVPVPYVDLLWAGLPSYRNAMQPVDAECSTCGHIAPNAPSESGESLEPAPSATSGDDDVRYMVHMDTGGVEDDLEVDADEDEDGR